MDNLFNEKQSLELINSMITQAKNNVQKGAADAMILNGWAVATISLLEVGTAYLMYYLNINPNLSFIIWSLMIPINLWSYLINKKQREKAMVKTHIDNIIRTVWNGFGISIWLFVAVIFTMAYGLNVHIMFMLITPVILLFCGMAQYITAKACNFKPFFTGALTLWGGALACVILFLIFNNGLFQFLILAACMIIAFVIPGRKLNRLADV